MWRRSFSIQTLVGRYLGVSRCGLKQSTGVASRLVPSTRYAISGSAYRPIYIYAYGAAQLSQDPEVSALYLTVGCITDLASAHLSLRTSSFSIRVHLLSFLRGTYSPFVLFRSQPARFDGDGNPFTHRRPRHGAARHHPQRLGATRAAGLSTHGYRSAPRVGNMTGCPSRALRA